MNCEEVRANLSLYVAGDIERHGPREMLDAHLGECDACRTLAAGWELSHRLLQLHQPPEFDAAFFDSVRRDVLRRIAEPKPSLFARLLGQPFGQRTLTYAAAFSLLVCAAILSAHFLRSKQATPAEVANEKNVRPEKVDKNIAQEPLKQAQQSGTENVNQVNIAATPTRPSPSPRRRIRRESIVPERKSLSPSRKPDEVQAAYAPRIGMAWDLNGNGSTVLRRSHDIADNVRQQSVAAADREMLRIELQTADPNIRIIWLSPRTTGSASSGKTSR